MKNVCRVRCEPCGKCRSQSGIKYQQTHPAKEEGSEWAEAFAQVHVRAARTGESSGEFAKAERAAERHGADGEPDDEQPEGRGERLGHARGCEEDADGDCFASDDCGRGAQAELATEILVW